MKPTLGVSPRDQVLTRKPSTRVTLTPRPELAKPQTRKQGQNNPASMKLSKMPDERRPLLSRSSYGGGSQSQTKNTNSNSNNKTNDVNDFFSDPHKQFCMLVGAPSSAPDPTASSSSSSFKPPRKSLYGRATRQLRQQRLTYYFTASLSNTLLLSQVVLGAALTALGASESSHILITVFGAMNTIIAGLVAYLKSRGQPMRARMFRDDLERVVDEIENSEIMWLGITRHVHGYDEIDTDDHQVTVRSEVARLTRLFDRAVRTNTANNPDMYMSGGPGYYDPTNTALRTRPNIGQAQPSVPAVPVPVPVVPSPLPQVQPVVTAPVVAVDPDAVVGGGGVPVPAPASAPDPDESPATAAKPVSAKEEPKKEGPKEEQPKEEKPEKDEKSKDEDRDSREATRKDKRDDGKSDKDKDHHDRGAKKTEKDGESLQNKKRGNHDVRDDSDGNGRKDRSEHTDHRARSKAKGKEKDRRRRKEASGSGSGSGSDSDSSRSSSTKQRKGSSSSASSSSTTTTTPPSKVEVEKGDNGSKASSEARTDTTAQPPAPPQPQPPQPPRAFDPDASPATDPNVPRKKLSQATTPRDNEKDVVGKA